MKTFSLINMFVIISLLMLTTMVSEVKASNAMVGFSGGIALGFDSDFNNQQNKTAIHFDVGFDALYKFPCNKSTFCDSLFLELGFDMIFSSNYDFGATQVLSSGNTGNFKEDIKYYSGLFGLRKEFMNHAKLRPFVGLGLGVSYIQITNTSFTDALGNPLNIDISASSLNFEVAPSVGLAYYISHKLAVDVTARLHLLIPNLLNNSYIEFPIGLKYVF